MPRPSTSGFHGVRWDPGRKKFKVSIWNPVTYKLIHGGYFDKAETAAHVYDELAVETRGMGGLLNFPRDAREQVAKTAARKEAAARERVADEKAKAAP